MPDSELATAETQPDYWSEDLHTASDIDTPMAVVEPDPEPITGELVQDDLTPAECEPSPEVVALVNEHDDLLADRAEQEAAPEPQPEQQLDMLAELDDAVPAPTAEPDPEPMATIEADDWHEPQPSPAPAVQSVVNRELADYDDYVPQAAPASRGIFGAAAASPESIPMGTVGRPPAGLFARFRRRLRRFWQPAINVVVMNPVVVNMAARGMHHNSVNIRQTSAAVLGQHRALRDGQELRS